MYSYCVRQCGGTAVEFDKVTRHSTETLTSFAGICWALFLLFTVCKHGPALNKAINEQLIN